MSCHVLQHFWFRHVFLFPEEDSQAIQSMTVELLSDKKLEVQELAASTLSGLLQVCSLSPPAGHAW
jgi:hypothetical protein